MSDKLESFIRDHRGEFDAQVPSNQVWTGIQAGIAQQAATAAGSSAGASTAGGAAGKAGFAKLALGWKIALVTAITAVVGTGIFIAATSGGNSTNGNSTDGRDPKPLATVPPQGADDHPKPPTQQVEYLYENSPLVTPPLPQAAGKYAEFKVSADKGGTWTAPSGTVIKVAPGTFVDAQDNPVTGDVAIQYREFHDAEDVILSGITMKYNENGADEVFQTAGMMEILGSQGEAPVFIAAGKSIDVRMASFTPEDNYNLYFLDPQKGWKDIGKPRTEKNKQRRNQDPGDMMEGQPVAESSVPMTAPRPPVKGQKGVEMDGEMMFDVSFEEFPELQPYKDVRWMIEDKAQYKKLEQKIHDHVWEEVKLEELDDDGLRYKITLTRNVKSSLSILVRPILEGEDYEKGMERFREKKAAYDKAYASRIQEDSRQAVQAEVYRTFTISGFGIYNCDRFYRQPDATNCNTEFVFPTGTNVDHSRTVVFHISGDNRVAIPLDPYQRNLSFLPRERNFLVAILSTNKIAVFGPDGFARLKGNTVKANEVKFEAKDMEIRSAADLRLALGV
jgi:hypothetical protein